jgi:hypothetical protein
METAVNFYELRMELEALGFRQPELLGQLQQIVISADPAAHAVIHEQLPEAFLVFDLNFEKTPDGRLNFRDYFCNAFAETGDRAARYQLFSPEISQAQATQVMQVQLRLPEPFDMSDVIPRTPEKVSAYLEKHETLINEIKRQTMNEQNLDFLNNSVKYLGFEEKTAAVMDTKIRQEIPEFQVIAQHEHFNNSVFHTLHFKKSSEIDMYFFNKYHATLSNGKPEEDRSHTFYVKNGQGFTAKEAFNLLEGRAVYKELKNKEGQPYTAWSKLELDKEKDKNNNYPIRQFSAGWGYDLEKSISRFPVQELKDPEQKAVLLKSLQKGNQQQVTIEKDGKSEKFYLEAVPALRTVNIFDTQRREVKRDTLLKPELKVKKEQKNDRSQSEDQKQGKKRSRGKGI